MRKRFAIIIVNYNVADYIENLISSIYRNIKNDNFEIIIVDNNSSERDIEQIKDLFPEVNLLLLKENKGFSGGNNYGAEVSNSEYVVFINPDTLLENDCISPLVIQLEENRNIGIITSILKYGDKSYQSAYGKSRGIFIELIDSLYITKYPYLLFKKLSMYLREKFSNPFEVKWVSGAFMVMRKETFENAGSFDIAYPLNYEDMDLCRNVLNSGLKIIVDPRQYLIHFESKSQKKNFYNFVYKRYVSKLIYLKKHLSPVQGAIIKSIHTFGLYLRLMFLFTVKDSDERAERKRAFEDSLKLYLKK